ncbi:MULTISPECIES: hypothetical protein [unclassified Streptomyces]|uniref:hypothetical protein n=1 Tax=unclassified Streptomyces TaxID=2593676 RepID=UPI00331EC1E0
MTRSAQSAVHGMILAAMLALGAPQAFAASDGNTTGSARPPAASSANAWTPPTGFTREDSFFGTAAACESTGRNGIAEGKWSAYVCVQAAPFTPFRDLYVKK